MHHFFLSKHYLEVEGCNINQTGQQFTCEGKTHVFVEIQSWCFHLQVAAESRRRIEKDSKIIYMSNTMYSWATENHLSAFLQLLPGRNEDIMVFENFGLQVQCLVSWRE